MNCCVCLDAFNEAERFPRLLACGHGACTSCLNVLFEQGCAPLQNGLIVKHIKCPLCRSATYTDAVEKLTPNQVLMDILKTELDVIAELKASNEKTQQRIIEARRTIQEVRTELAKLSKE